MRAARLLALDCVLHHVGATAQVKLVTMRRVSDDSWLVEMAELDGSAQYLVEIPRDPGPADALPFVMTQN